MSYLCYLNTFSDLLDRLEHLNEKPQPVTDDNADTYTEVDARIAICNPSHYDLKKGYKPFLTKCQPALTKEEIDFVAKHRIDKIENCLAKGFYADVLCNAQEKPNGKYAREVIINYLDVIRSHHDYKFHNMRYIVCSVVFNCMKYHVMQEEVRACISEYILSDIDAFEKFRCLTMCYEYGFFTSAEVLDITLQNNLVLLLSEDYSTNHRFYTMLQRTFANKHNELLSTVYIQLAHNEDKLLIRQPYSVFDANALLNKFEYLKKAGCEEEAQKTYEMFLDAKNNGRGIHPFTKTFTLPKEYFQRDVDCICKSEDAFATLAIDESILPDAESPAIDPFADLRRLGITIHFFDNNGNPHIKDDYDRDHNKNLGFGQSYIIKTITAIMISLRELINSGQFSFDGISKYLANTWLSDPRQSVNAQLRESKESWLDIITPPLRLLCNEIIKDVVSQHQYNADYVCAIDSLTMKLEGCIREICRRRSIPTVTEDKHNEILLEKLLDKLGEECNLDGSLLLTPCTHKLLMTVLTKQGYNLRNNIAHGFTNLSDYNLQNAIMVLHSLLKISAIKV